jgi:hypothetical protein
VARERIIPRRHRGNRLPLAKPRGWPLRNSRRQCPPSELRHTLGTCLVCRDRRSEETSTYENDLCSPLGASAYHWEGRRGVLGADEPLLDRCLATHQRGLGVNRRLGQGAGIMCWQRLRRSSAWLGSSLNHDRVRHLAGVLRAGTAPAPHGNKEGGGRAAGGSRRPECGLHDRRRTRISPQVPASRPKLSSTTGQT